MIRLFDEDGHLSIEAICRLKEGALNDDELIKVLDHISDCSECAGILSESYDENELAEVPEGFEESIELKIHRNDEKGKTKFNFGFYCMKVIAAASIAIMMLFSNELNSIAGTGVQNIKAPDYGKAVTVCSQLNSFSQKIINLEVFK